MVVIHRAFRRESQLIGELIASIPDGETARAAVLAAHLDWYMAGLDNHHHGEDELIWPLLASVPLPTPRSCPAWSTNTNASLRRCIK
jgi:Hemerythrin HHE cation binding domain